jgi:uncharacterized protein (DUF1501 family)
MAGCDDFHRTSEATRRRMLDPPELTRRQALGAGIGAGLTLYLATAMPVARVLEAAEAQAQAAPAAPVLVSVFLPGGADLLDTLVPLDQFGTYADLRPTLKREDAAPLGSTGIGIHPSLARGARGGVRGLFDLGKVGFLPGIDYANPDLSHFHSRNFWQTGILTRKAGSGWLGRWLDTNGVAENPLQGVTMAPALSPLLRSGRAPVAAVTSPADSGFAIPGLDKNGFERAMEAYTRLAAPRPSNAGPTAADTAGRFAKEVGDRLGRYAAKRGRDPIAALTPYPKGPLGSRLKVLAGLLSKPLGIRVASVEADADFDTHDNQSSELAAGLGEASEALAAFQLDLELRGLSTRVTTFVWTEFGRRPKENDSGGSDHGAGGLAWVQGSKVRGGLLSAYPDLKRLDRKDNLAVTVDFRSVYASLLEQWMQTDATAVIPDSGSLPRVPMIWT